MLFLVYIITIKHINDMKKFILSNYNDKSQDFVKTWIGVEKVICVKQDHCRKDEHYVFYEGNEGIRICTDAMNLM